MGDPESEGRFERARELHRRAMQRSLDRWRGTDTLIANATLRAGIQPLPDDLKPSPEQASRYHQ
jgi:hypothetical protein